MSRAYSQPRAKKELHTVLRSYVLLAFFLPQILYNAPFAISAARPKSSSYAPTSSSIALCPPTISFGETIECSINTITESDSYTFVANSNDVIQARVVRTSDTLRPRISILDPNGRQVCGANSGNPVTWIDKCTLASGATYKAVIDDSFASNKGSYTFYLQRLNNPGAAQPIAFGQTVTSTIERLADAKTYQFTASVDDTIQVRMTRTSETLRPRVRIFYSSGAEVCSANSGDPVTWIDKCKLPSAGTYTMLVDDTFSSAIGNYTLYLQRLNNPGDALLFGGFGQTLFGSIERIADAKTYKFTASVDDTIQIRITRTSETLRPRVRIFYSNGAEVCSANSGNPVTWIDKCKLPSAGTYTMLVDDTFSSATGNYTLYLQRLNNPDSAQPINYGQTLESTIERIADAKTYTFVATGGDLVQMTMTRTSDSLRPRIRIFGPTGIEVCSANSGNPTTQLANCSLVSTGIYTVLVDDTFSSSLGSYTLALQCLNTACAANPPPACGVQANGLNTCELQPGDILLQKYNSLENLALMNVGGTYFTHAALYLGNERIAQAVGLFVPPADQVIEQSIESWTNPAIYDWVVIRPNTTDAVKQSAVEYAKAKANATAPIVTYSIFASRSSQQDTYCSLLIWQAYNQAGVDLEQDRGGTLASKILLSGLVTPDDLFYSSGAPTHKSTVVQKRETTTDRDIWRWTMWILSPAHLVLTDPEGRRSGYDATTGTILDEIPGVTYSGPNATVETISVTDPTGQIAGWKLAVTGFDTGSYEIEAGSVDSTDPPHQIRVGQTVAGKVENFSLPNPIDGIVIVPEQGQRGALYIPLISR